MINSKRQVWHYKYVELLKVKITMRLGESVIDPRGYTRNIYFFKEHK